MTVGFSKSLVISLSMVNNQIVSKYEFS